MVILENQEVRIHMPCTCTYAGVSNNEFKHAVWGLQVKRPTAKFEGRQAADCKTCHEYTI